MRKSVKIIIFVASITVLAVNIFVIRNIFKEKDNIESMENIKDVGSTTQGKIITSYADGFTYEPLPDDIKKKITGISYKENGKIDYSDLRYVLVKYYDFDGNVQNGELIVNVQVADDVVAIFKELYDNKYKIEKIRLIDEYGGDDEKSMEDNNTSAFNYRNVDGQEELSDHSYGIAIDINPLYNPYVRQNFGDRNVLPVNGISYADRTKDFQYKITKNDVCYLAFATRGWKWGGDWESPKDYQHFYKELE